MKRVMIIGQPGSGKSTLARLLGERTGLPVVHCDMIHWQSGWVERKRADKIALALASHAEPEWIFEGGLSGTMDVRLQRADTLIVLDLPLWLRMWRVFCRTLRHYGQTRPDLPDGCPERFSADFWGFIWRTRNTGRANNMEIMASAGSDKAVYHLTSPHAVRRFLAGLEPVFRPT